MATGNHPRWKPVRKTSNWYKEASVNFSLVYRESRDNTTCCWPIERLFLAKITVGSMALVLYTKWYRNFREIRWNREKGNTSKGITFFPENFHRNEVFHLNSYRNSRVFRTNGKRSWIPFLMDRIVCRITLKMCQNCPKLLCFGSFAGAGAHHQGLRRLKPCQFQRTVYWRCEFDKLCSNACCELLAVCCSWTRDHKANDPHWKLKVAELLLVQDSNLEKIANCLEVDFPRSRIRQISQDATGSDSCCLAAWLRWLTKRELIELLFAIFFQNFLFELEAEEVFCNVYPVNKRLIWRKVCSDCSFVR